MLLLIQMLRFYSIFSVFILYTIRLYILYTIPRLLPP